MLNPTTIAHIDRMMRIAQDVKKTFAYNRSQDQWAWHDKGEENNIQNWQGPFNQFSQALASAVEPYIDPKSLS